MSGMIKFTIIWVIVYFVATWFSERWAENLEPLDTLRVKTGNLTKRETLWFCIVGILRLGSVIFGAISVIMLVIKWL